MAKTAADFEKLPYERNARRNAQWHLSMIKTGKASWCPVCGAFTKAKSGYCRGCFGKR